MHTTNLLIVINTIVTPILLTTFFAIKACKITREYYSKTNLVIKHFNSTIIFYVIGNLIFLLTENNKNTEDEIGMYMFIIINILSYFLSNILFVLFIAALDLISKYRNKGIER